MIEQHTFDTKFIEMVRLCGFTFQAKGIQTYRNKLQYENQDTLFKAFDLMADDPPVKLNLKHIRSFIGIAKGTTGEATGKWNGAECTDPECDQGLIPININGNKTSMRCTRCNSYDMPKMMPYTQKNVDWLRRKYEEIDERKGGKIVFLNNGSFQI